MTRVAQKPSEASRDAHARMNGFTFANRGRTYNRNARRNKAALKKMTISERDTGKTPEELAEVQAQMRADFYRRRAEQAAR